MRPVISNILDELVALFPMPDDAETTEASLSHDFVHLQSIIDRGETYDTIIKRIRSEVIVLSLTVLERQRLVQCILQLFGLGEGEGIFWDGMRLIETIAQEHEEEVFEEISQGLQSNRAGVRAWSAILIGRRGVSGDIIELNPLVYDPEPEVQIEAIRAIAMCATHAIAIALQAGDTGSYSELRGPRIPPGTDFPERSFLVDMLQHIATDENRASEVRKYAQNLLTSLG
jgi:hypothetical protein